MTDSRRWTLSLMMGGIANFAALLALSRYPFGFGFVVPAILIVLFVAYSVRRKRYGRVAKLICFFPVLPLLTLYCQWILNVRKFVPRSSTGTFDGILGSAKLW